MSGSCLILFVLMIAFLTSLEGKMSKPFWRSRAKLISSEEGRRGLSPAAHCQTRVNNSGASLTTGNKINASKDIPDLEAWPLNLTSFFRSSIGEFLNGNSFFVSGFLRKISKKILIPRPVMSSARRRHVFWISCIWSDKVDFLLFLLRCQRKRRRSIWAMAFQERRGLPSPLHPACHPHHWLSHECTSQNGTLWGNVTPCWGVIPLWLVTPSDLSTPLTFSPHGCFPHLTCHPFI